jgi:hypothetical protein
MSTTNLACQEQEDRSASGQDSSKGALLITPIAIPLLKNPQCPICHEPYTEPPSSDHLPEPEQEWAVRVDMIAEWFGTKRCCGHIVGRKCLEKHLKGPGPCRNKCPLCRDVWFHDVAPRDAQPVPARNTLRTPRRSQRIAERGARMQGLAELNLSSRYGVAHARSRQRATRRPARFTQQLLAALEVEEGTEEVRGSMEEIERRLNMLYGDVAG